MTVLPVALKLPRAYLIGIGRVTTTWALVEHEVRRAVFAALGVGPKHGRVAVRDPRADESIILITDLLRIDGIDFNAQATKQLASLLKNLKESRDVVCHSLWLNGPKRSICIQDLSGTWNPDPKKPAVKRKVHPQALPVKSEALERLAGLNLEAARRVRTLHDQIVQARQASP